MTQIESNRILWRGSTHDYFQAPQKDTVLSATGWNSDQVGGQVEQRLWKQSVKQKYITFKDSVPLIAHMHRHTLMYGLCTCLMITRHTIYFTHEANKHNYQFLFISIEHYIPMQNSMNDSGAFPLQQQQRRAPLPSSYLFCGNKQI